MISHTALNPASYHRRRQKYRKDRKGKGKQIVGKKNKSENKTGPLQVSLLRHPASALYVVDVVRRLISHACLQAAVY